MAPPYQISDWYGGRPPYLPYRFRRHCSSCAPLLAQPSRRIDVAARNFRYSAPASFVPRQLKSASILPVPKIPSPLNLVDYSPISITPALCRTLERIVDLLSESSCNLLSSTHPYHCHLLINTLSVLQRPPLLCSLLYRQSLIS